MDGSGRFGLARAKGGLEVYGTMARARSIEKPSLMMTRPPRMPSCAQGAA